MSKNNKRRILTRNESGANPSLVSLPYSTSHKRRTRSPSSDELLIPRRKTGGKILLAPSPTTSNRPPSSPPPPSHIPSTPPPPSTFASAISAATCTSRPATPGRRHTDIPESITLRVNLRYGQPYTHCRVRNSWPAAAVWNFRWEEDTLDSLIAKVRHRTDLPTLKDFEWGLGQKLYIKQTHNTPQHLFLRLDNEDYEVKLKRAWTTEARRLNGTDNVMIDLFAYLTDTQARGLPQPRVPAPRRQNKVKRSSQRRVQEEDGRVELDIEQTARNPMGSMFRSYLARNLAKKVQQTPLDQLAAPQRATFRQPQHLDDERAALDQRNAAQSEERHANYISIQATLRFNISDLRHALRLPDII